MRIVMTTDIHWGQIDRPSRLGDHAEAFLHGAFNLANGQGGAPPADLFVDLGDRIAQHGLWSAQGVKQDRRDLQMLARTFNGLNPTIQREHILGNYDVSTLRPEDNEDILGHTAQSHIRDVITPAGPMRLVFWNDSMTYDLIKGGFTAHISNVRWLFHALKASPHPVILFSHMPLDGTLSDVWPEHKPFNRFYTNYEQVLRVILNSGKVRVAFNGHLHDLRLRRAELEGSSRHIHWGHSILTPNSKGTAPTYFLTLPSLTEAQTRGAVSVINIDSTGVSIDVCNMPQESPVCLRVPLPPPAHQEAPCSTA